MKSPGEMLMELEAAMQVEPQAVGPATQLQRLTAVIYELAQHVSMIEQGMSVIMTVLDKEKEKKEAANHGIISLTPRT